MTDLPKTSIVQLRDAREHADGEALRAAAKSGYEGHDGVVRISDAMKERDRRRAERERQAAKVHYLGTPPKPRQ